MPCAAQLAGRPIEDRDRGCTHRSGRCSAPPACWSWWRRAVSSCVAGCGGSRHRRRPRRCVRGARPSPLACPGVAHPAGHPVRGVMGAPAGVRLGRSPMWLLPAALAAAAVVGAGAAGGSSTAAAAAAVQQPISAECVANATQLACAQVLHTYGYHDSSDNLGVVTCNGYDEPQICTSKRECTTCGITNCLLCLDSEDKSLYSEPMGVKFLFVVVSLLLGAVTSTLLELLPRTVFQPPFTVIMFVVGVGLGWAAKEELCAVRLRQRLETSGSTLDPLLTSAATALRVGLQRQLSRLHQGG
jgi:hypothetical protein